MTSDQQGGQAGRTDGSAVFDGFDPQQQARYEAELVERFGPDAQTDINESWRRIAQMSKADAARIRGELAERDAVYGALLGEGVAVEDPRVHEVTAAHYRWICQFWTPTAEAFLGLGEMYVEHPDFRARYDAVRPGLAEYVRAAIAVYAIDVLT
ncbi:MAG: TipAS antibiotic-recognition domain-containing protein [Actinomycetes bacterium]